MRFEACMSSFPSIHIERVTKMKRSIVFIYVFCTALLLMSCNKEMPIVNGKYIRGGWGVLAYEAGRAKSSLKVVLPDTKEMMVHAIEEYGAFMLSTEMDGKEYQLDDIQNLCVGVVDGMLDVDVKFECAPYDLNKDEFPELLAIAVTTDNDFGLMVFEFDKKSSSWKAIGNISGHASGSDDFPRVSNDSIYVTDAQEDVVYRYKAGSIVDASGNRVFEEQVVAEEYSYEGSFDEEGDGANAMSLTVDQWVLGEWLSDGVLIGNRRRGLRFTDNMLQVTTYWPNGEVEEIDFYYYLRCDVFSDYMKIVTGDDSGILEQGFMCNTRGSLVERTTDGKLHYAGGVYSRIE